MKKNSIDLIHKANGKTISIEDMKMKVREYLDKLNDSSTRDLAFQNFKILLQTYTDENSINTIFPLLLSYSNDATTIIGKEYQIILIAFALNINYIKNPSYTVLTKIMKAIACYLGNYNNFEIQKACAVVIIEIFDQIVKMGANHENALSFILKYFLEIIDKNRALVSQPKDNGIMNGGYIIISDILSYVISLNSGEKIEIINNENNIKNQAIEQINRKIERDQIEKASTLNSLQKILEETLFDLINKFILLKYPNPYLIESITHLIDVILYNDYKNKIIELIPYLNKILYNTDAKLYMSKVMICQLYSHLFKRIPNFSKNKTIENLEEENKDINVNKSNNKNLSESEDEKLISEMVQGLNYVTKDRVIKVQVSAEEALILYDNRNNYQNDKIQNKRKMSKLNLLRNLSKINKEKNNIMSSKEVRKEIYNIGIGKFLRSNDYLNNRGEENLLEIKKELNKDRSKSKSKEKKDSFNDQRKKGKYKRYSSDKNNGGIKIFQRFDGFKEEQNQEGNNTENINIYSPKNKNEHNKILLSLKDDDIDLNNDIDKIKNELLNKNKQIIEDKYKDNNNIDITDKEENINIDKSNKNDNIKNENNDNFNEKEKEEKSNNQNANIEKEKEKEKEKKENDKSKEAFIFEEEKSNKGDQAILYNKEEQNINNNSNIINNEKENIINKSINSKNSEEEKEKLDNNNLYNNNNNDISNNNDSSNIQCNTIEDINKINHKYTIESKRNSVNNKKNNQNELLEQLKENFTNQLNELSNDFINNTNTKLNNINNRILGLSQNINRIKSNLNLLKHTNNLKFRDSKIIIHEENEDQLDKSESSIITEKNDGRDKYNTKSYNILWETISLYLKNEKFEEAYIKALQGGDDIIFLRLIFSIGTWCLPYISVNTNKLILKHFNSIFRTFSMQNKFLEYIESFYNMNMLNLKYFTMEELNDFMQTLYEIKAYKNEIGVKANTLYNYILKDFSSYSK